jgi:hypothetical protein
MKLEIDLKNRAYPEAHGMPASVEGNDEGYPSFVFYYDEPREFPEEGTMVIKYCVLKSDKDIRRPEDSQHSCTISVEEVVSAEGEKNNSPTKNYSKESEDALDNLASQIQTLQQKTDKMVAKDEEVHAAMEE